MNEFWTNILRYPRFFVSSLIGLVLIILTPFRTLLKTPKLRLVLIFLSILLVICLYNIIINMIGL
jgi:hypothetical protein